MAQLLLANPRKRRRRTTSKRKSPARRRSYPRRTTYKRRYRRNPIGGGLVQRVQDAAIGGAGALAVDFAVAKLPIPANLKQGAMAAATKGVVAVGIGMLVSKGLKKRKLGEQLAAGGMTVALYEVGKNTLGAKLGIPVGNYGDDLLGYPDGELLGYFSDMDDDDDDGLAYFSDMDDDDDDDDDDFDDDDDDGMGYTANADTFDIDEDF